MKSRGVMQRPSCAHSTGARNVVDVKNREKTPWSVVAVVPKPFINVASPEACCSQSHRESGLGQVLTGAQKGSQPLCTASGTLCWGIQK